MNSQIFKFLGLISCCAIITSSDAQSAEFNYGEACSTQGAVHIKNSATNVEYLICNGTNWILASSLSSTGNSILVDDDPSNGSNGCVEFNAASQAMSYSDDCTNFERFGGLWSINPGNASEIYHNSGNVGIGTNDPSYNLDVSGDIAVAGNIYIGISNNRLTMSNTNIEFNNSNRNQLRLNQGSNDILFGGASDRPSRITFGTNNLLYVHSVSTAQKVGVGKSSPNVELDVVGDIHFTEEMTDVSDSRAKNNIKPLMPATNRIMGLKPISFVMKDDHMQRVELGFTAQNVEKYYPELVENYPKHKALNYFGLISPLTQSVLELDQDTQNIITHQNRISSKLNSLDKRLKALELNALSRNTIN